MRLLSADEMRAVDRRAIEEFGIPALCLMENAGRSVADTTARYLRRIRKRRVGIVCGTGNNGGDGFVAARYLRNAGFRVTVFYCGDPARSTPETAINFQILRKLVVPTVPIVSLRGLSRALKRQDVLVDAIFGVGLSRDIRGDIGSVIEAINASGKPVIAVDVPSGLDATTGEVRGVCVKARKTVTLAFAKKGLSAAEGPEYSGKVVVADIGIPLP